MLEDSRAEMQVNCDSFRGDASIVSNNRRDDVGVLAGNLSHRSRRSDRFTDHLGMGAAFTTHDRPESVLQDDEAAIRDQAARRLLDRPGIDQVDARSWGETPRDEMRKAEVRLAGLGLSLVKEC